MVFHVFKGQHPAVGILLTLLFYPYWRGQGKLAAKLSANFHLVRGVTTAFVDPPPEPAPSMDLQKSRTRRFSFAGALPQQSLSEAGSLLPHRALQAAEPCSPASTTRTPRVRLASPDATNRTGADAGDVPPAAQSPRPLLRRMSTTGGSMMAAAMSARKAVYSYGRDDHVATEALPSPVVSIDKSKPVPVRLLNATYNFFNPVSHRLHFLFEQVSEDFEGQSRAANAAHRSPTEATRHLIDRTEMDQAATMQGMDNLHRQQEEREGRDLFVDVLEAVQEKGLGAAFGVAKDWLQGSAVGVAVPARGSAQPPANGPVMRCASQRLPCQIPASSQVASAV